MNAANLRILTMRNSSSRSRRLLLALLALVAPQAVLLQAEDVIITACPDTSGAVTPCPPSCCSNLGISTLSAWYSKAIPAGVAPRKSRFGIFSGATWTVTPTLGTSPGAYRVYVSKDAANDCPTDLIVRIVATSGGTLYDTNGVPAPSGVDTPAFQQGASVNVWTPVCIINNTSATPSITFSYVSGDASKKWYMDEVRFENLGASPATPARITRVLYGNPIIISGTGPVSHTFALVSSTNAQKALNQWTPEQSDISGTGSFTFSVPPGTQKARFFRVITQ